MKPIFLSFLVLISLQLRAQTVLTHTIRNDAASSYEVNINSYYPNSTDSESVDLIIADWTNIGTPSYYRYYIKFDLTWLPSGATIDSAHLSFYADPGAIFGYPGTPTYGSANESKIFRVSGNWTKSTLNWNTQPTIATDSVVMAQSTSTLQNYTNINVTNIVKNMITNGNHGFLLRHTQESAHYNSMIFYSSHASDSTVHPTLVVKYTTPTAVSNIGQPNKNWSVDAYPNPFQSEINLSITSLTNETIDIRLFDIMGREVLSMQNNINEGNNKILLPSDVLHPGIYILKIFDEENSYQQSIIKL